jgi:two-component system response regulator YesN
MLVLHRSETFARSIARHFSLAKMEGTMSTVLIVDDDQSIRSVLHNLFENGSGFEAFAEAGDSTEAVDLATRLLPNLVVLDSTLPHVSGLQLARRLKIIMPQLPIFMLTEDYTASSEKEALSCGVTAVFSKLDDLAPVVANARAVCELS